MITEESPFISEPTNQVSFGASDSMASSHIGALDLFKTPLLLSTTEWNTTQPPSTELTSFSVPKIFESTATLSTLYAALLQIYSFFKFQATVRIQINSTKFHSGKLIACYDPVQSINASDKTLNIYSASCLPNVIIDAADSNTGSIDIPFEHILSYLSTNSGEPAPQMGTFHLLVLNSLGAAASTPSTININTFIYCTKVGLEVPLRPHKIQLSNPSAQRFVIESGIIDKGISKMKTVTNAVSTTWDNVKTGNFSGAIKSIGNGIKDFFNLDKPALLDVKVGNTLATIAPLAHMKGEDASVRLAATNQGGYLENIFSSAPPDEMCISEIIKRPTLADQISWPSTAVESTQLFKIPVHPGYCNFQAVPGKNPACFSLNPTYLAFMSTYFDQWKGSINFRFDFAATQFHTGRLQFSFEPNADLVPLIPPATTTQDFSNSPEVLFDLHENKTVNINIPYVSTTMRKLSRSGPYVAAKSTTIDSELYILGYLYIRVLVPLVAPSNVAPDITFNVYVSAGEDFQLFIPRIPTDLLYYNQLADWPNAPFITESSTTSSPTSEEDDDKSPLYSFLEVMYSLNQNPPNNNRFVIESGTTDAPTRTTQLGDGHSIIKGSLKTSIVDPFREVVNDVRDLARRYCLISSGGIALEPFTRPATETYTRYEADLVGSVSMLQDFVNADGTSPSRMAPLRDFAYAMSRIYAFWSGSHRYKFIPTISKNVALRSTVTYIISQPNETPTAVVPFDYNSGSTTGYPAHTILSSQDSSLEFETPFYSPYQQLLCYDDPAAPYTSLAIRTGVYNINLRTTSKADLPLNSEQTPILDYDFYHAVGDDFAYRFLVAPPILLRSEIDIF